MAKPSIRLVGKRVGWLVVLEDSLRRSPGGEIFWRVRCDCGTVKEVQSCNLAPGRTTSCGCRCAQQSSNYHRNKAGEIETRIRAYRTAGLGITGIMDETGWSKRRVDTWLRRLGLAEAKESPQRSPMKLKLQESKLKEYVEDGMTISDISCLTNWSYDTVRYQLRKLGLRATSKIPGRPRKDRTEVPPLPEYNEFQGPLSEEESTRIFEAIIHQILRDYADYLGYDTNMYPEWSYLQARRWIEDDEPLEYGDITLSFGMACEALGCAPENIEVLRQCFIRCANTSDGQERRAICQETFGQLHFHEHINGVEPYYYGEGGLPQAIDWDMV